MKADTEALPARASELDRVLRDRLGRTLTFGGGLARRVRALSAALKGEIDGAPHHHDGDAPDHAAPESHDPAQPGAAPGRPAASASGNVTIVSVHAPTTPVDPHPAGPGRRLMTTKERNDALRLAVADFNDYWSHRSAREGEMRAVVAELCDPGPRRPRLSHSGGGH